MLPDPEVAFTLGEGQEMAPIFDKWSLLSIQDVARSPLQENRRYRKSALGTHLTQKVRI